MCAHRFGIRGIFGCVRPGILYNKGQALMSIYESMTSTSFADHKTDILFADDSKSNIDAVERECDLPDEQNMLIDKTTAMTQDHMDLILEFFEDVSAANVSAAPRAGSIATSSVEIEEGSSSGPGRDHDASSPIMSSSGGGASSPSRSPSGCVRARACVCVVWPCDLV